MLLTCRARLFDQNCLQVQCLDSTVCWLLSRMSYLSSHVLRRCRGLTSRKLSVCLQTFLYVFCIYLDELMSLNVLVILHFVRSRFKCSCFRATLLTVLRTVYPIGRISSGLSSVLTFFRSSKWISSVAGNSKILWTNIWHAAVKVFTRWHSTGRYY